MEEIGISMQGQEPKLLSDEMVEQAARIISMGCGVDAEACPAHFLVSEDWGLENPAGKPIEKVREIRDAIKTRVAELLLELSQT
jgi:arsenate reductase